MSAEVCASEGKKSLQQVAVFFIQRSKQQVNDLMSGFEELFVAGKGQTQYIVYH